MSDLSSLPKYLESYAQHKTPSSKDWKNYWLVLRGNVIFVFDSGNGFRDYEAHKGTLTVNLQSEVRNVSVDKHKKYKFELVTIAHNGTKKINKFKFDNEVLGETWRGFIYGLSKGDVPQDIRLTFDKISNIRRTIAPFVSGIKHSPRHDREDDDEDYAGAHSRQNMRKRQSEPMIQSHVWRKTVGATSNLRINYDGNKENHDDPTGRRQHRTEAFRRRPNSSRELGINVSVPMRSLGGTYEEFSRQYGTPIPQFQQKAKTMHAHKFYRVERNQTVPSWFFEGCSRDDAEAILMLGKRFGNVLMRESVTFKSSRSYVISVRRDKKDGTQLNHYEVKPHGDGYKLNVENPHDEMACLSDVMNFFVKIIGRDISAMTTNNLKEIGFLKEEGRHKRFSPTDSGFEDPIDPSENWRRSSDADTEYLEANNRPILDNKESTPTRGRDEVSASPKSDFSQLIGEASRNLRQTSKVNNTNDPPPPLPDGHPVLGKNSTPTTKADQASNSIQNRMNVATANGLTFHDELRQRLAQKKEQIYSNAEEAKTP
ncbi:DgyrCDS12136 [Dimorphilus gyrociliatus]|uniref:DgyrCDS12136 n=1 Tax=Dimorphilus gyrociliatus TaxID=2664684 RepID=A0A7I8W5P1_9ANNE|nr:DgyrCDS12136 [Dimorphilus gyrociliatus]